MTAAGRLGPLLLLALLAATARGQWVEDSIDVSGAWVGSLCYNAAADVVYGATSSGDRVFAIACSSNAVVSSFWAQAPSVVCYDPTDNKAYCTRNDQGVVVMDGNTHRRVREIPVDEATFPVWDAASDRLYVSCMNNNEVAVIDCQTDSVIAAIHVPDDPGRMYVNPLRRKLYVLGTESVSILDITANRLIRTLPAASYMAACYVPSVDRFFFQESCSIAALDGQADSVVGRAAFYGVVQSMVWSAEHNLVMVGADVAGRDTVYVVDPVQTSIVGRLPGGRGPDGLLWSPATDLVYCASSFNDSVIVYAGDGSGTVREFGVGGDPYAFARSPVQNRIYLSHLNGSKVYVIRDPVGIAEDPVGAGGPEWAATTVLAGATFRWAEDPSVLVDVAGRAVMKMVRGENDLSRLAPGVYVALGGATCIRVVRVK
jgi:YVTN family beta-propeller protein